MDQPQPALPYAQRWRLSDHGRRWFDVVLATALLLPVIGIPVAGQPATWAVLCVVQVPERLARRERAAVGSAGGTETEWARTKRRSTCWRRS